MRQPGKPELLLLRQKVAAEATQQFDAIDASAHVRLWNASPLWALTWGLLPLLALLQANRLLNGKTP